MNSLRLIMVVIAILGLSARSVAAEENAKDCNEAANAFLSEPSKITFAGIGSKSEAACWTIIGAPNDNLNHLLGFVAEGNRWAAEYLSKNLRNLDGGNLEDSLISLGQFSEKRMDLFLIFAKAGYLSTHEFTDALTMLPLSLSDDQKEQLSTLNVRRKRVIEAGRKGFDTQKSEAIKAIDNFISEIKSKPDPSDSARHS